MKITIRDYGPGMDREMQALCDTLNALPGVYTVDSCGGHGKRPPMVFFFCTSFKSLAKIQRAIDPRYGGLSMPWRLSCTITDVPQHGTSLMFVLDAERPYNTKKGRRHNYEPAYYLDTALIMRNIGLYCTKWGDAACRGLASECPAKTWEAYQTDCRYIRDWYAAKMHRWNKQNRKG